MPLPYFCLIFEMITISQAHYHKLVEAVELLHGNLGFYLPSHLAIEGLVAHWKSVNQDLDELYLRLGSDLSSLLQTNAQLEGQNREIKDQVSQAKTESASLLKTNTIQRAELAKNQADYNKLKEVAKGLKTAFKQKD